MLRAEEIKEKIISVTMDLIEKSSGQVESITTRAIAEKAGVGVGLINYHFQTKENLIEICVQKIIGGVIAAFRPEIAPQADSIQRLKEVTKQVADFLMANPAVSRISILGDLMKPKVFDNTMKTVQGFSISLGEKSLPQDKERLLLFGLTAILQGLFLRKETTLEAFGYDFSDKSSRDSLLEFYIDALIGRLTL